MLTKHFKNILSSSYLWSLGVVVFCALLMLLSPNSFIIDIIIIFLILFIIGFMVFLSRYDDLKYVGAFLILLCGIYNFSFFIKFDFPIGIIILTLLYPFIFFIYLFQNINSNLKLPEINLRNDFTDKFLISTFFILFLISAFVFNSQDSFRPSGMSLILCYILGVIFFVNIFCVDLINNERMLNNFLRSISCLGLLTAIFGLLTVKFPGLNLFPGQFKGSAISFTTHPNLTASIYNYSIPVTLFLIFYDKKNSSSLKTYNFLSLMIMFLALLLTLNRFAILISFFSIFIIIFYKIRKRYTGLLILIFALALYLFFNSDLFISKGADTLVGRISLFVTAVEMLKYSQEKLFWGYGVISTIDTFREIKESYEILDSNDLPHNIFILYVLVFGLLSAIPLFIYFFKTNIKAVYYSFKNIKFKNLLVLSISICIPMIIKNLGEDIIFFPVLIVFMLYIIFFGFMIKIPKLKEN